ncbi:MAG: tRNA lysidine(34) synthetase TilS, partial [Hominilimicola sp.]
AIYLSCDKTDKIIVRNRRNGDKFQPLGMNGTKKLKEYFIDKKIPKDKRNSVPIIEINGEIAAVGNRIDKRFAFRGKGIKIEFYDN